MSESFLDSTISDNDNNLHMKGYNLIRADHPSSMKRGGVCLYFKKSLALRKTELSHITECLLLLHLRIKSSIISIDGNITDNIVRKVINV